MTAPEVTLNGPICTIELAEPAKLNPLSPDVLDGLEAVVMKLRSAADIRILVLRGQGKAFSAGADIRAWPSPAEPWQEQRLRRGRWQRLLDDLESLPQVSIARLHGHVIGGAALLALSCDLRVAGNDLRFRIPELALGIPLTWGGLPRLAREIGLARTRDLVLTGRTLTAQEALEWGVVTRLANTDGLDRVVAEVVESLLEPPAAVASMSRASLAAIGRDRMTAAGWADVDLYLGANARPESEAARQRRVGHLT